MRTGDGTLPIQSSREVDGSTIQPVLPGKSNHKAKRRTIIVRTAAELFSERGYESTSVNDIADALQMSVGGLYRYIDTKSDLLTLVCEDIYGELVGAMRALVEHGGDLLDVSQAYLHACAANRRLILLMYREYRHLPQDAQRRFEDREAEIVGVLRELAEGCIDPPLDPEVVASDIVLLGHLPALKGWALRRQGKTPDALADEQVTLIAAMAGLPRTAGSKRSPTLPGEALSWTGVGLARGGQDR